MAGGNDRPTRKVLTPYEFLEAARTGDAETIKRMLADGYADIGYAEPGTGLTALHYAAARNAKAVLKLLVATGKCDFTRKDRQGRTAATLAIEVADNPALGRYLYDQQHKQQPQAEPAGDATKARKSDRRAF
jgi:hypothetical protein